MWIDISRFISREFGDFCISEKVNQSPLVMILGVIFAAFSHRKG